MGSLCGFRGQDLRAELRKESTAKSYRGIYYCLCTNQPARSRIASTWIYNRMMTSWFSFALRYVWQPVPPSADYVAVGMLCTTVDEAPAELWSRLRLPPPSLGIFWASMNSRERSGWSLENSENENLQIFGWRGLVAYPTSRQTMTPALNRRAELCNPEGRGLILLPLSINNPLSSRVTLFSRISLRDERNTTS